MWLFKKKISLFYLLIFNPTSANFLFAIYQQSGLTTL